MEKSKKRIVEIRMLVVVLVDLTASALTEAVISSGGLSLSEIVTSAAVSRLESLSYVDSVIATHL